MAKRRKNLAIQAELQIQSQPLLFPDVITNIQKMKEERRIFYEEMRELDKLKQDCLNLEDEETKKMEILSLLTSIADVHPGKKIFKKKLRYQYFSIDTLSRKFEQNGFDFEEMLLLLQLKLDIEPLSAEIICQLFFVMSIKNDILVCNSCYELLLANLSVWSPKIEDVINVFLNWGTNLESFALTSYEKSIVFSNNPPIESVNLNNIRKFCSLNFQKVFSYITEIIKRNENYTEIQIIILLKCVLKITLDKKFKSVLSELKNCIIACVRFFKNWDSFKIVNISALIHDSTEHFHNQVTLVMDIIPKVSKCNDINSCLSLTILRIMINSEVKYIYPFTDSVLLDLVKSIKIDVNSSEDLYKAYMIIHLLNHIVYHRNMFEMDQSILDDLIRSMDTLKWEAVKSTRIFDADLLKSRISYCTALWSLFRRNEN